MIRLGDEKVGYGDEKVGYGDEKVAFRTRNRFDRRDNAKDCP